MPSVFLFLSLSLSPPPLSLLQLIIATAGVLSGYNGSFEFKEPGQKYEDTPYYGMRLVSDTHIAFLHCVYTYPVGLCPVWYISCSTRFPDSLGVDALSVSFNTSSCHDTVW